MLQQRSTKPEIRRVNEVKAKNLEKSTIWGRSVVLFANFFLIICAYYQVKAASRSLLIEYAGADWFPYAWILSAFVLLSLIGGYHNLVARYDRARIVLGSLVIFALLLVETMYHLAAIRQHQWSN